MSQKEREKAPVLTGAVYVHLVLEQERQVSFEDRFIQSDTNMSACIQIE